MYNSKKVLIISEELVNPIDEGIKKTAHYIYKSIKDKYFSEAICNTVTNSYPTGIRYLKVNKSFFSVTLMKFLKNSSFFNVIYIPGSCGTIFSFIRATILNFYGRIFHFQTKLILLQPKEYTFFEKLLIKLLSVPDIYVMGLNTKKSLEGFHFQIKTFFPGIDINKYYSIQLNEKKILREKYNIPEKNFVALHVGHINQGRQLIELCANIDKKYLLLVVGSTSTPQDQKLKKMLEDKGVIIINYYIDKIEEIYQLSDCYIFHVTNTGAAIEVPLSVLEAMAVNLPVITTKFGGLTQMFSKQIDGLYFIDDLNQVNGILKVIYNDKNTIKTREAVSYYSWEKVGDNIIED